MKYLALSLALGLALTGCTSKTGQTVGCAVQTAVVSTATVAIADGLQCENSAAISALLTTQADKLKICDSAAAQSLGKVGVKSVIGDVCTQLGQALVANLAAGAIPADWKCSPTAAVSAIAGLVTKACNGIPLSSSAK